MKASAHKASPSLPLPALLWQNRGLVWQFTQRNIQVRHKGSALGIAWTILQPLLMLAVYTTVFGLIMGGTFGVRADETPWDYALGIFLGLTLYNLTSEIFSSAPSMVLQHPNLVKKVVFPLEVLPTSAVMAACYHCGIALGLCGLGLLFFGPSFSLSWLWLPVIVLPLVMIALGLALGISALAVYMRDVAQITGVVSMILFYASAIFYPASKIPAIGWQFLRFNPFLHAIELAREVTLWAQPLRWEPLVYLYFCGIVSILIGSFIFRRLKSGFADVL